MGEPTLTVLMLEFALLTDRLYERLAFDAPEPPAVEVVAHYRPDHPPPVRREPVVDSDDSIEPPRQFMRTAH